MGKGLAEPGLVVAELGLGDGQVLPDAVALRAVAAGQPLHGVQDGPRPVMLAGEHGLARRRSFEVDVGDELRMQDHAEAQAAIDAERHAAAVGDVVRQGVEGVRPGRSCTSAVGNDTAADGQWVGGVNRQRSSGRP